MSDDFDPHALNPEEFAEEVHSFEFWFQAVEGYLSERPYGNSEDTPVEELSEEASEDLITILCNYCVGETAALEGASGMVRFAPNRHSKIFLATQAVDEARHLEVFMHRLRGLGVADPEAEIARRADPNLILFKQKLLEFVDAADWEASVFAQNVILETMEQTAFFSHVSFADPQTKEMLEGIIKDERRHLGFGENDLGRILAAEPEVRSKIADIRSELDALVLATFTATTSGDGDTNRDGVSLGGEYLAAIERLGLV